MEFRVTLLQRAMTVGDIAGNSARLLAAYRGSDADVVVAPEMALTGYPVEDLALRPGFVAQAMQAAEALAAQVTGRAALLVGGLWREGERVYNAAFFMAEGRIMHRQYKHELPNYGVFDERRVFAPGALPRPIAWRGVTLGVLICEDVWRSEGAQGLKAHGADLLIAINASPFCRDKHEARLSVARARVAETELPLLYLNLCGGQDELVFDGGSFALAASGEHARQCAWFAEETATLTLTWSEGGWQLPLSPVPPPPPWEARCYAAMVLALRDYAAKNGFTHALLGLSGGMDSALVAAIAADALGAAQVSAIMLPSSYTSRESLEDAAQCAEVLGIGLDTISIAPLVALAEATLAPRFHGKPADITEENLQSRMRGLLLMAASNKERALLLTTGNKSEMAVGYATLYGDMCGGFNVLKDLYKTDVYHVAAWRNAQTPVIPARIFAKAPSAELRPDQTDQDSLPIYCELDAMLAMFIEGAASIETVCAAGFPRATVERVARLLLLSEYKRRQSAPGPSSVP